MSSTASHKRSHLKSAIDFPDRESARRGVLQSQAPASRHEPRAALAGFCIHRSRLALHVLLLALCLVLTMSAQALAAPGVLVVMRTAGAVDPTPYELRLRSELRTEGIEAVIVSSGAQDGDTKALVGRMGATGAIEVNLSEGEATASVWVREPQLGAEIARSIRVSLTQRDAVSVFALRAVDLLVAARMELEQQRKMRALLPSGEPPGKGGNPSGKEPAPSSSGSAPSKPKASEPGPPKATTARSGEPVTQARENTPMKPRATQQVEGRSRFRLGGGVSLMRFTDKLTFRLAPSLSGAYFFGPSFGVGLNLTGPFLATIFKNSVSPQGVVESNQARIDQEFFWLDARYRLRLSESLDVEPALGLGLSRYAVDGISQSQVYTARNPSSWSVVSTIGGSLAWRVSPKVRLMAEAAVLLRWATPYVVMDGQDETGKSPLNFWGSVGPAWAF